VPQAPTPEEAPALAPAPPALPPQLRPGKGIIAIVTVPELVKNPVFLIDSAWVGRQRILWVSLNADAGFPRYGDNNHPSLNFYYHNSGHPKDSLPLQQMLNWWGIQCSPRIQLPYEGSEYFKFRLQRIRVRQAR
jgi:hypothetical protein